MESRKYRAERQKLFLTVQSAVLPRYGLEGTERGVFEMLSQFDQPEIHSTEEFQQMGNMLNDLLYGGEPAVGAKVVAEAPKEVQVRVRRAGGDTKEEVHVTVPSTASMLDVRTAVARKCNASFLHEGRLVRNQGGVLVGYKDSEPLGGRRRLLFVGPPLWPEGAPIAAPEAGAALGGSAPTHRDPARDALETAPPDPLGSGRPGRPLVAWRTIHGPSSKFGQGPEAAMRNRGPGKWREWRWGATVVPLYPLEGPPPNDPLDPSASKPLSEIAHLTITKLTAKSCQAKLTDGIAELVNASVLTLMRMTEEPN
eukprot:g15581.t1